jgi:hypothetical protein
VAQDSFDHVVLPALYEADNLHPAATLGALQRINVEDPLE